VCTAIPFKYSLFTREPSLGIFGQLKESGGGKHQMEYSALC